MTLTKAQQCAKHRLSMLADLKMTLNEQLLAAKFNSPTIITAEYLQRKNSLVLWLTGYNQLSQERLQPNLLFFIPFKTKI